MPNSIGLKSNYKTHPFYGDFSLNLGVQEPTVGGSNAQAIPSSLAQYHKKKGVQESIVGKISE